MEEFYIGTMEEFYIGTCSLNKTKLMKELESMAELGYKLHTVTCNSNIYTIIGVRNKSGIEYV